MAKFNEKTQRYEWATPAADSFDWTPFEDGWNGTGLKANKAVKTKDGDKVFCHESYAQGAYNALAGVKITANKELKKNALVSISDINVINDDTVMVSINGGSNNVVVDLNKENQFFNQFTIDDAGTPMTKEVFVSALASPKFKEELLGKNLVAKITAGDVEKASIWDGFVESLVQEMKEQITKNTKAYYATLLSTNRGGFVVDIKNTVKAFMPGSQASANKVTDFASMVGTRFEVMVESWDPAYGFVVSRKKFINTMLPIKIKELEKVLAADKNHVFTGKVTGTTAYGVYVELDDFITGMIHKTLMKDETREALRNNSIAAGTEVNVYVHKIEKTRVRENGKNVERFRVILSDVPSEERDAVIARREAEEAAEKAESDKRSK